MTNEQLVIRIKSGESTDQDMLKLYDQVKAFIHIVAKQYEGVAELEDLEQEGYLALYPSIAGFDSDAGTKFLTYAEYHIRQRMQRYIQLNGSSLRLPTYRRGRMQQYKKLCNEYMLEYGREPSERAVANRMGLTIEQVRRIKKDTYLASVGSLDVSLSEDEELTLGDTVPNSEDPEGDLLERMQYEQLRAVSWPMVDALPEKQAQVIHMRYRGRMTLKEAGGRIGADIKEARQWEAKAMRNLRRPENVQKLRPFLPEAMESMAYCGNGVQSFRRTWTSSTERTALQIVVSTQE